MCLQASKNIWTYRDTRAEHSSNTWEPNWVPTATKCQTCFHTCCFTPSLSDHFLPGLPTLFLQPGYLVNVIKEAERWLKKPLFFLHHFSSGSIPSIAWPSGFYHRTDAGNCAGQGKASQTKQHHWMWARSLGEATAISVPVAAGLSPLSLAMSLPTPSQTSCLLGCAVAHHNKPIRRLRLHWVGWAALTAGCHQKGQVCHSSSHLADSAD